MHKICRIFLHYWIASLPKNSASSNLRSIWPLARGMDDSFAGLFRQGGKWTRSSFIKNHGLARTPQGKTNH